MRTLVYAFERKYVFLGTTHAGARVLVSGDLHQQVKDFEWQTVNHGTVINPETMSVHVVAFTGRKNISRNLATGLHSIDYFGPQIVLPAPEYTIAEVRELVNLAVRWSGNTLRSGCAHMAKPDKGTSQEMLDAGITCPETGQRWGHTFYADPLPHDVRSRFIELMEKGKEEEDVNY